MNLLYRRFSSAHRGKNLLLAFLLISTSYFGQISGSKTIPTDYPSIATFVSDLNAQGVGSGGVTLNIPSGYLEQAPAGGFVITATGTQANPIIISGGTAPKPVITASGSHTIGALNDAIFKIVGADYVTLSNLELRENITNTDNTAATNNMTEWGIALLNASVTNGAENVTLSNNTIVLNRVYPNTFGIYANASHSATDVTTTASGTGANGSHNGLKIYSNNISNVNQGMAIVGPIDPVDYQLNLEIGSESDPSLGNTINDYGTTGTFSAYANVNASVYGILVRNVKFVTIGKNNITSSAGGVTAGQLRGIFFNSYSSAVTGSHTIAIKDNNLNLQTGFTAGAIGGIVVEANAGNSVSSVTISGNNFSGSTNAVAGTGTIIFINNLAPVQNLQVVNNTFSNLTTNSTGSLTFISHSYTMQAGSSQLLEGNQIVGTFNKTAASGSVTGFSTASSSFTGSATTYLNNNFSNIVLAGSSSFTGISNTDGLTANGTSTKTLTNNIFSNITLGTGSFTGITISYFTGVNSISGNTITGNTGGSTFTGITLTSSMNLATNVSLFNNTISNWNGTSTSSSSTGITISNTSSLIEVYGNKIFDLNSSSSGNVVGITISGSSGEKRVYNNKIYNLTSNNAGGAVYGISTTSAASTYIYNNLISGLVAPIASGNDIIRGISVTATTASSTIGVYHNTVYLNANSSGTNFGTAAIYQTGSTTATNGSLDMRNNIFINESVAAGTGITAAYRRSNANIANINAASNNNQWYAGSPSATNVLYTDGTNTFQTLGNMQAFLSPMESNSITGEAGFTYATPGSFFTSLTGANADFLKPVSGISTLVESGANAISSPLVITTDFNGTTRPAGTGVAPDMGAREFEGVLIANCAGTPNAGTISGTAQICENTGTTLQVTGSSQTLGITYQWKSSTTPGGPYTNMGISTAQATGNLSATTYYVVDVTCTNSGITSSTSEFTLTVNPLPVISIAGIDTVCFGTSTTLTASGADTYSWSPATDLSATTGSVVVSTAGTTLTYTVTGAFTATGCQNTASKTVTRIFTPVISDVIASPANVCNGASSTLDVTYLGASPVNQYQFSTRTNGTLDPMTGATELVGSGNDNTVSAAANPIGFNFIFNNNAYSTFAVSTDGWLLLGSATPTTQATNSVISSTNTPKIYPYWDDVATGTDGNVSYVVTGTAPNRILKVQWFVTVPKATTGAANSTYQAWLHETTGKIEFVYGAMGPQPGGSTSIGMTAAAANYQSVTLSSNTVSTTTPNNSNTGVPNLGTVYEFNWPLSNNLYQYAWTPATNMTNANTKTPTVNNITANGYYTVDMNAYGCSVQDSVLIQTGTTLVSSINTSTPTTVCEGTSMTITGVASGGGGPYIYSWTGPNGFTASTDVFTLATMSPSQSGKYRLSITDNCSAVKLDSVEILVNPNPVITINGTSNLYCQSGTAVNLTASGADTYAWSPAGSLSASTGAMVSATPSANTTYTAVGTFTSTGCFASNTYTVNYGLIPIEIYTGLAQATLCEGDSTQMTVVGYTPSAINTYTYTPSTGSSLLTLNSPTTAIGTDNDDTPSTPFPIGFKFGFNGVAYSNFSVSPDGWILLGTTAAVSQFTNSVTSTTNIPKIYPYWDDMATGTTGNVRFETQGTAPNRKLVVQWFVTIPRVVAGPANSNFQLVLHEGTNQIEFLYGAMGPQTIGSASSGLTAAANNYQSVTLSTNTVSTTTSNNSNSGVPVAGTKYLFAPTAPAPAYTWNPAGSLVSNTGSTVQSVGLTSNTAFIPTMTSALGCSVNGATQSVTVNQNSSSTLTATACNSYTAPSGAIYTVTGNYQDTIQNAVGCDSIININLTVNYSSTSTLTASACDSYVGPSGNVFTTSGIHFDTIVNAVGCDSIVELNLTILTSSASSMTVSACETYTSPSGMVYTSSGVYNDTILNAAGCDSVITIDLTINFATNATLSISACDSYTAPSGAIYTASGTYMDTIPNTFGCDSVMTIQLVLGNTTYSNLSVVTCKDYISPSGLLFTTSGQFNDTIPNAAGCDSVITIDLTINPLDLTIVQNLATLTVGESGATYQWLDCNNNYAVIPGATGQSFTATVNGNYAVMVDQMGCTDTSACVVVNNVGLDERSLTTINIYPNPTDGMLTVTHNFGSNVTVIITDSKGRVIQHLDKVESGSKIDLSNEMRGMYFLQFQKDDSTYMERVVKN